MTTTFDADSLRINFAEDFSIDGLFILNESTKVCANGNQKIVIRTRDAVSDPVVLEKITSSEVKDDSVTLNFEDEENSAQLKFIKNGRGIRAAIHAKAASPIWLVEWQINGFNFEEVLVPALGGQQITKEMPKGKTLSYKYPFWWNSQFVIGKTNSGGIILRSEDKSNDLKLLRVTKESDSFAITYGFEAPAPLISNELQNEFIIEGFEGDWKSGVDLHKNWMKENFDLVNYKNHPHFPKWMNNINFVLELWGARKGQKAHHTFEQMIDRINQWKDFHKPEETLLYLPGFAQNGVDSKAPNYDPSEQCGGPEKFGELIKTAHELGYRVMIHTNILAMTFVHPKYEEFKKFITRDPWGRELTWGLDIDGDWLPEPFFAYMNPGYKEWGDYMTKVLGKLIDEYKLDAVFVDQTLLAFNNSDGPNFIKGMHDHIKRLQEEFPHVLFAGEGINERVLPRLPVVQIHGIDSIAEVHGMDDNVQWRNVHPISSYLFGDFTKFTAHLLTKHTSDPMFKLQEESYAKLNVIPSLSLYGYEQEMDTPETYKMIRRAKKLNKV
ncbi:MAG: DUF6259 domain-containing protein [Melioribacteraceae bacterium]|nr:DUF6259 domain-containing protein [Melioribacteraceae bacterium]MCF8412360.1 DUF6259 domain-containing protein [Melioribacteraceae bacterium]